MKIRSRPLASLLVVVALASFAAAQDKVTKPAVVPGQENERAAEQQESDETTLSRQLQRLARNARQACRGKPKCELTQETVDAFLAKEGINPTPEVQQRLNTIRQGMLLINPSVTTPEPVKGESPVAGPGGGVTVKPPDIASQLVTGVNNAVVTANPDNPAAVAGRGIYRANEGKYREAYADLDDAIRRGHVNPKILLAYGQSAFYLGDYATAANAAQLMLKANPSDRAALGLFHNSNGRAPAVSLPSSLGVNFSGKDYASPSGASPTGGGYAAAGGVGGGYAVPSQTPEQAAAAARAQTAGGQGAVARSASFTKEAAAALQVRDYSTAHQLASQAIALNSSNAQALNFRAIASNKLHRFSDAVTDASAALALAPGNAPALTTRSWAFAKQGNYLEALRDAEETLSRDPSNPHAYQNKALALAGMKDRAGALEALRRSAALDPRYQNNLERALQLPEDQDMTLLFNDVTAASPAAFGPPPVPAGKRFARLALLSALGGILIALAILHVVSASWREKVNMTIRRVLASADKAGGETAVATPLPGAPGAAFWLQYELVKEIGLGGMGVVYEALDRSLERRVAVKKMRDEIRIDPHERRRFVNEAKLVAQLHHPNIVDIYAIIEEGQEVYLVFEFVSGRTLHDQIKSDGPMTLEAARGVLHAASEAVEHAHAAQIVHRDLKPSNIMITDDGRIKVMDFGVARQAKDAITKMSMTNTVVGTPPYMAPEQEQGTVRRESDVYALGVCLYEMLTGHLPFTGGGAAMLLNKLNGKHIPPSSRNPALPAALDEVIAKALVPDPEKRYHTPSELVAALDAVISAGA